MTTGALSSFGARKRFLWTLLLVFALSLPVVTTVTYMLLKDFAIKSAYESGALFLSTVEATKHYVSQELRPRLFAELGPDRFILEGMSRSYVSGWIARDVNRRYSGYKYKNAANENPRNPANLADEFERGMIKYFNDNPREETWEGIRESPAGRQFVIARPGEPYVADCLRCHGQPSDAPPEMISVYGPEAGFWQKKGQRLDAKFVYIPIEKALNTAIKNTAIFVGIYIAAFALILAIINRRFRILYDTAEEYGTALERINTDLSELNRSMDSIVAERTLNLMALSVADKVRNPAAVIGGACHRLLRKSDKELQPEVRQAIEEILSETQRLEHDVAEIGRFLEARKSIFMFEDLNEVVTEAIAILGDEFQRQRIELVESLEQAPLRFNMDRNLIKAAVVHAIRNAIEATAHGGSIYVSTMVFGSEVAVQVRDSGEGIKESEQHKLFDPFYSTRMLRYGIGLPLIKEIASEHMGRVEIKSQPGQGTTLTLYFPTRWKGGAASPS